MFSNDFQGGPLFDVFSVQGSNPLSKWRTNAPLSSVRKDFDKHIKSAIIVSEGDSTRTKIIFPKDEKQYLGLVHPVLVLQVFLPNGQSTAFEIVVVDNGGQKRRIFLSSSYKSIAVTAFHVKIPLSSVEKGIWLNLCIDIQSLLEDIFRGETFRWIDNLSICGSCKLKRIFTLKNSPNSNEDILSYDNSRTLLSSQNGSGTQAKFQLITLETLLNYGVKFKVTSLLKQTSVSSKDDDSSTHIAFGKRVSVPTQKKRQNSATKEEQLKRNNNRLNNDKNQISDDGEIETQNKNTRNGDVAREEFQHIPHPPLKTFKKDSFSSTDRAQLIYQKHLSQEETDDIDNNRNEDDMNTTYDADHEGDINDINEQLMKSQEEMESFKSKRNTRYANDANNNKLKHSSSGYSSSKSNETSLEVKTSEEEKDVESVNALSVKDTELSRPLLLSPSLKMAEDEVEEEYFKLRNYSRSEQRQDNPIDPSSIVSQLSGRSSNSSKMSYSESSDGVFSFSSRPRSVGRSSRSRQHSASETNLASLSIPEKPKLRPRSESQKIIAPRQQQIKDDDFHGESSDNDTGDEKKIVTRPKSGIHKKQLEKIRQSIRSDMLREINPPKQPPAYDQMKYQTNDDDSMSWMYDSDSSTDMIKSPLEETPPNDDSKNTLMIKGQSKNSSPSPLLRNKTIDESYPISDEDVSAASDDMSWKAPPLNIHNYRYQKEMNGLQMTLDLSETLPLTPFIENSSLKDSLDADEFNFNEKAADVNIPKRSSGEGLLDLLYDPVFKCYFDPVSRKYYELI